MNDFTKVGQTAAETVNVSKQALGDTFTQAWSQVILLAPKMVAMVAVLVVGYVLARWIVTSPAGTEAFNAELGRLTLLSYPVIALPSMAMTIAIVVYLAHGARKLTGLAIPEVLHHH